MSASDPVMARIAEENPVHRLPLGGPDVRMEADRVLRRILTSAPQPPVRRWSQGARGLRSLLATAVAIGVAVVVALLALGIARHHPPPAGSAGVPAGARQLVAKLAVLRRAQTAADRLPESVSSRLTTSDSFRVYLIPRLTRLAATIKMGPGPLAAVDIYLVVVRPPTAPVDIATTLVVAGRPGHRYLMDPPEVVDDQTAIETRGITPTAVGSHGYTPMYGGAKTTRGVNVAVVPDGVTRVKWVFNRTVRRFRLPSNAALSVYPHVENNVAVATASGFEALSSATWYGPDGHVIATLSPQAQRAAEQAQAFAQSVHRPIAPALIRHLAVFRRPVPPPARIKPLPRQAAILVTNQPYDLNVSQARFIPYPGTAGVWLIPGTQGISMLNQEPCERLGKRRIRVCGGFSGGNAPTRMVLSGAMVSGLFGPHRETIWGVAPDGNATVTAMLADGTRRTILVVDNVYTITLKPQSVQIIEKDAGGHLTSNRAP
jgi:hypothetical protein